MSIEIETINKDIQSIIEQYKTPFYMHYIPYLQKNIEAIKRILTDEIHLCYSIKANPLLVPYMQDLITFFEVCSYGEYEICRNTLKKDKKIIFGGVYKHRDEIKEAIKDERVIVTVESLTQINDINECCKSQKIKREVLLRMSTGNQFGLSKTDLEKIIINKSDYENIEIKGVQLYASTQCFNIDKEKEEIRLLFEKIDYLEKVCGYSLGVVNYGGGIGVPYYKNDFKKSSWDAILTEIVNELNSKRNGRKIVYEAGRIISATCGVYVSRVCDQKINGDRKYSILDGGTNHIKYFGQAFGGRNSFAKILKNDDKKDIYTICGPLCTANDILLKDIELAQHDIGDIIIFLNAGAYCQTEGIGLFLSRDLPVAFAINENRKIECIRERIKTSIINIQIKE